MEYAYMYALYYTVMYIWDYIVYFFSKCASFERCWVKNKKYNICNFLASCKIHGGDSNKKVKILWPGGQIQGQIKDQKVILCFEVATLKVAYFYESLFYSLFSDTNFTYLLH